MLPASLFYAYHAASKSHSAGAPHAPLDPSDWPDAWTTTVYKTYPRLPKIPLPQEALGMVSADFFSLVRERQSSRKFGPGAVSARDVSVLLGYSCGNTGPALPGGGQRRRAQPSGGGLFPLEVYPIVFRDDGAVRAQGNSALVGGDAKNDAPLSPGVYHYNVRDHALDVLWERRFTHDEINEILTYPWLRDATAAFIITGVFERTQQKYGERGYRYILLEAGHLCQNLILAATALGLKNCALGGTKDEALEQLLDTDGVNEAVVYGFAVGR